MGRACTGRSRARTRFIAYRNYQSRKAFRDSIEACLQSHRSGLFEPGAKPALQKCQVKKLDLVLVTLTNSFLGERVGNKKLQLQLQLKNYENSSSNH
jgi:hypothetical protein